MTPMLQRVGNNDMDIGNLRTFLASTSEMNEVRKSNKQVVVYKHIKVNGGGKDDDASESGDGKGGKKSGNGFAAPQLVL